MKYATLLVLLAGMFCPAQSPIPDAPEPKGVELAEKHKFLTVETKLELGASAFAIAMDGLSTMKVMAGFAAEVAGDYVVYRKGWKKAKRFIPLIVAGWETFVTIHNYHYVHHASAVNNCLIHNPVMPGGMSASPCSLIP